ncbi:MAG: PilN domain-containing protein [Phycisphaerae bacterium]|nr:PilN domain-containing protein [Phycisphaerae bacterium]MBN8597136.1 PilN domain-containing protein [Planctomycetota bacterium]
MVAANLLPAQRRRIFARQDRAAKWTVVVAIYTVLLSCLWIASRQYVAGGRAALERRVASIQTEKAGVESAITGLREKSAGVQASLATARSIADHPDWSVLLSLIATIRGNDIEIDRIALGPRKVDAKPEPKSTPAKTTKGVWVRVSGLGKDHQAIAQFALRLEGAGLFERVALADARKSTAEPEGLVGFEIEAQIEESPGSSR